MARERLPGWPGDQLTALAEQAPLFYAVLTPELVDLVRRARYTTVCLRCEGRLVVLYNITSILTPEFMERRARCSTVCLRCEGRPELVGFSSTLTSKHGDVARQLHVLCDSFPKCQASPALCACKSGALFMPTSSRLHVATLAGQ